MTLLKELEELSSCWSSRGGDFEYCSWELSDVLDGMGSCDSPPDGNYPQPNVTRVEVIDRSIGGNVYSGWGVEVTLSYQDDGRTLKVFVKRRPL